MKRRDEIEREKNAEQALMRAGAALPPEHRQAIADLHAAMGWRCEAQGDGVRCCIDLLLTLQTP